MMLRYLLLLLVYLIIPKVWIQNSHSSLKSIVVASIDVVTQPTTENEGIASILQLRDHGVALQNKALSIFASDGQYSIEFQALEAFDNCLQLLESLDIQSSTPQSRFSTIKVDIYQRKAFIYYLMADYNASDVQYDLAIANSVSNDEFVRSYQLKSDLLAGVGQLNESLVLLEKALELDAYDAPVLWSLSKLYSQLGAPEFKWSELARNLSKIISDSENHLSQRAAFSSLYYWSSYMVYDKLNDTRKASNYLLLAHKTELTLRGPIAWEDPKYTAQTIKDVFSKEFVSMQVATQSTSRVPVFIVGMMRSGSTLLETMLDSHRNMVGLGEGSVFNRDLAGFRNSLLKSSGDIDRIVADYANKTTSQILRAARLHVSATGRSKSKKSTIKRVVDKMLFNYKNIGFIHFVFPRATIIHIVRDPLDTLFSCLRNKFDHNGLEWSMNITALINQYVAYLDIMHHFREVLPRRVVDIQYEDLVHKPEAVMRQVLQVLGLPWDPAVLNFHSSDRVSQTNSQSQVRKRLYTHSIGGWRRYADQIMGSVRSQLDTALDPLRRRGALPFVNSINWDLSLDYDYASGASNAQNEPSGANIRESRIATAEGSCPSDVADNNVAVDPASRTLSTQQFVNNMTLAHHQSLQQIYQLYSSSENGFFNRIVNDPTVKDHPQYGCSAGLMKGYLNGLVFTAYLMITNIGNVKPDLLPAYLQDCEKFLRTMELILLYTLKPSDRNMYNLDSNNLSKQGIVRVSRASSHIEALVFRDDMNCTAQVLGQLATLQIIQRNHIVALKYLDDAVLLNPDLNDIQVLRIKVLIHLNRHEKALIALSKNINTAVDKRELLLLYTERARVYSAMKRHGDCEADASKGLTLAGFIVPEYSASDKSFNSAMITKLPSTSEEREICSKLWHSYAKCRKDRGDFNFDHFNRSLQIQFSAETLMDRGWAYVEYGDYEAAKRDLNAVVELQPNSTLPIGYKGLLLHGVGLHQEAIDAFKINWSIGDGTDKQVLLYLAVSHHAIGNFSRSLAYFDRLLALEPAHPGLFQREYLIYCASRASSPLAAFDPDTELVSFAKEGFAWRRLTPVSALPDQTLINSADVSIVHTMSKDLSHHDLQINNLSNTTTADMARLVQDTTSISDWVQLRSPGFLPNRRHHRAFGVSVLQAAQHIRAHLHTRYHSPQLGNTNPTWRSLTGDLVRWRQLSEVNDPVFWLDQFAFQDRTGLNTYMIKNGSKVVRYYPYLGRAVTTTAQLINQYGYYTARDEFVSTSTLFESTRSALVSVVNTDEIMRILGVSEFYVIVPITAGADQDSHETNTTHIILNGTRIVFGTSPGGLDVSICYAGNVKRSNQFEKQLNVSFNAVMDSSAFYLSSLDLDCYSHHSDVENRPSHLESVKLAAFNLYYDWINYAPLSRGTSFVGLAILAAIPLSLVLEFKVQIPVGVQLDWEALLEPDRDKFIRRVKNLGLWEWVPTRVPTDWITRDCSVFESKPNTCTNNDAGDCIVNDYTYYCVDNMIHTLNDAFTYLSFNMINDKY